MFRRPLVVLSVDLQGQWVSRLNESDISEDSQSKRRILKVCGHRYFGGSPALPAWPRVVLRLVLALVLGLNSVARTFLAAGCDMHLLQHLSPKCWPPVS